jgi:molecular chaperone DnaJ
LFENKEFDLVIQMPISMSDAILGTTIKVPTIDGTMEDLTIPPGTNNGSKFVIPQKGLYNKLKGRSNLLVFIKIETLKKNSEIEKLMDNLRKLETDETLPERAIMNKKIQEYQNRRNTSD